MHAPRIAIPYDGLNEWMHSNMCYAQATCPTNLVSQTHSTILTPGVSLEEIPHLGLSKQSRVQQLSACHSGTFSLCHEEDALDTWFQLRDTRRLANHRPGQWDGIGAWIRSCFSLPSTLRSVPSKQSTTKAFLSAYKRAFRGVFEQRMVEL